jgi:hypothetical protein
MTTAADDTAVENAFEAYLAGRSVSDEPADSFESVAVFAEAVRATATQPGRPNAALAELLALGLLADRSSPSVRTAPSAGAPPSRGRVRGRNRRRLAMLFPALLAKLLSAGAVAQAATGAGIAVVVVTGAGVAGVLPDPIQETVATAVETVTPFELPADEDTTEEPVDETTVEEPVTDETVVEEELPAAPAAFDAQGWLAGPQDGQTFGSWVSQGTHNKALLIESLRAEGVSFGQLVSARASQKGLDADHLAAEGVDLDELTDAVDEPVTGTEAGETPTGEIQVATTQRGNGGKATGGGGSNSGNGNGKDGGSNGRGNGRN